MTLTELRYIVTLAQEEHFGRAAERCFVSQPTLSIAVKKLEEELDVALFERSKTRVHPTPLGEKIVAQAQIALEQTAAIKDLATAGKDQLSSPLKIGAIFTIGPYLFPHFIPELQKSAKQMPLYIEEGYTATLRHRLRNGELDVIIVALPFTEADVVTQALYEEPFEVLIPVDHPLAEKTHIEPSDLDDYNVLLLGEGHCFRDQILEACPNLQAKFDSSSTTTLQAATEGSSLETLRHMVASGLGITVLPQSAAGTSHYAQGVLTTRSFSDPAPTRTVGLAWRASFPRHQAIDALRSAICDGHGICTILER
ncbi:hydrogen peroxide-inducible genes activator [Pseudoteredinibacter isoporae]|uniref:LysR family hydrogen peroxide-inducible transcriptional activator n=1 Tax=Pseudoteredinibacter isoporae TaxID=570281 RepID=A0A7X0JQ98_9GAMM|nr:hydrogen peroxide-inducible genes activator [Pseudoteredinibacter isoporae]MBB6520317.1 LysR family hydrogen peroxide-inducible transcriptional activator [Pseudoteredinibacter isoporae]NHO85888.1 hydrogen peroxide-inducible genes activator [Pseudoteredinibacter isoporae]NIB25660.1 hydrogen peroxide-inducible genes activator [Pseudoteredinibacter isoporae]